MGVTNEPEASDFEHPFQTYVRHASGVLASAGGKCRGLVLEIVHTFDRTPVRLLPPEVAMSAISLSPSSLSRTTARPVPKLRLTRRGRLVITVLVLSALVLATLGLLRLLEGTALAGTSGSGQQALTTVVVKQGQTLWQVAQSVDPAGDPRDMVLRIEQINGLQSTRLVPGQSLLVPAA
jgi:LysM repeat protein